MKLLVTGADPLKEQYETIFLNILTSQKGPAPAHCIHVYSVQRSATIVMRSWQYFTSQRGGLDASAT